MNFIKRILYKLLGQKNYLFVISKFFFLAYKTGFLKKNPLYDCHYFVKKLINQGDFIIDIGANLGYYSRILAKLTGNNGKVYSVEPVDVFRKILKKNTNNFKNVSIFPFALGKENDSTIEMVIPDGNKYFSHGRTRITNDSDTSKYNYKFEVKMVNPTTLFQDLPKLDYIKCDVEGYEVIVFTEMLSVVSNFHPIIQLETDGENKSKMIDMLSKLGYKTFYVSSSQLHEVRSDNKSFGDLIFIPKKRLVNMSETLFF